MSDVVMIALGGREFPMTPSFRAYVEIEGALRMSLPQIYEILKTDGLGLQEITVIVVAGLNAAVEAKAPGAEQARFDDVSKHLYAYGGMETDIRLSIAHYLINLGYQSEDSRKKKRAEWAAPTPSTPPAGKRSTSSRGGKAAASATRATTP